MSRASPLKLVASAVVIALGLAGCGGGDSDVSDVSEADVVEALNLRAADPSDASDPDPEYVTADGRCRVYQILIGEDEVAVYAEAGGERRDERGRHSRREGQPGFDRCERCRLRERGQRGAGRGFLNRPARSR